MRLSNFQYGCIAVVSLFFCIGIYSYDYYASPGPLAQRTSVLFKKGTGFRQIVDQMYDAGVIRHPLLFKAIAVISGDARKFKAGEYNFSAAISPRLIMEIIAEGRVVVHKITIAEGLSVRQVIALLGSQELLEGVIVNRIDEGSLLPQTYHYVYGDQRQDIISRMQAGMRSTLAQLWEKRAPGLPFATPEEALTLASIVEKETSVPAERGRVAAVYINRLRKGMKLQADPTVIYGIEQQNDGAPLGHALTGTELRSDTPYNTYLRAGLPPTPIANPGRQAIEAVLNPPDTKDFYFVATGTGGHNFSPSYEGHSKNVKAYRTIINKQKKARNTSAKAP